MFEVLRFIQYRSKKWASESISIPFISIYDFNDKCFCKHLFFIIVFQKLAKKIKFERITFIISRKTHKLFFQLAINNPFYLKFIGNFTHPKRTLILIISVFYYENHDIYFWVCFNDCYCYFD